MEDYFKTIIEYININIVNNIIKYRDQITIRRSRFFRLQKRSIGDRSSPVFTVDESFSYIYIYLFLIFFLKKLFVRSRNGSHKYKRLYLLSVF